MLPSDHYAQQRLRLASMREKAQLVNSALNDPETPYHIAELAGDILSLTIRLDGELAQLVKEGKRV